MTKKLSLHSVLKNGYSKDKAKNLEGYVLDNNLSNDDYQTYYNPKEKKLLYNVTGTHKPADWITNLKMAIGRGFKESDRYKNAHKALRDAKKKYGVDNATVVGHSLGGQIANYISSGNDKVLTYDKATTLGASLKHGTHFRTAGDIVSLGDIGKKHSHTLAPKDTGGILKTLGKGVTAVATENPALAVDYIKESAGHVLNAHKTDNIKDAPIFV